MKRAIKLVVVVLVGATVIVGATVLVVSGPAAFVEDTRMIAQALPGKTHRLWLLRRAHALDSADVEADVRKAVNNRDFRLILIHGFAPHCPGLDDQERDRVALCTATYGIREMVPTGDVILSDEHGEFQRAAYDYAVKYNRLLFPKIPPP